MDPAELDAWMPRATVRVVHARESTAPVQRLWDEAAGLKLDDCAALGRLVRWRIPGLAPDVTFERMLHEPPFVLLDERPHRVLSGLAGRIWTLHRDYPELSGPQAFREWRTGGTARVLLGIWGEALPAGGSRLTVEVRVQALGLGGRVGVTALGPLIRSAEHLLGAEALRAAAHRAERTG